MNIRILFTLVGILCINVVASCVFARYYCDNLCWEQAQSLLSQGHYYLDSDNDGEACERSSRCSGGHSNTAIHESIYRYTCPANSYQVGDKCKCNEGYKTDLGLNRCVVDQDYSCNKKYPGTKYRKSDNMCICPYDGNSSSSRDPVTKECLINDKYCIYYHDANAIAFQEGCICAKGYVINSLKTKCIKKTNNLENQKGKSNNNSSDTKNSGNLRYWFLGVGGFLGLISRNSKKP